MEFKNFISVLLLSFLVSFEAPGGENVRPKKPAKPRQTIRNPQQMYPRRDGRMRQQQNPPAEQKAGLKPNVAYPYESDDQFKPVNKIDQLVLQELQKKNIKPANLCSDEVFIRRVYLDLTGNIPDPQEVRRFLSDERTGKRIILINSLLEKNEFADYSSLKWCDVLRVKAEFPINLWPNAVQAYHRWIRQALLDNMPYDQFARELLTSSGSNFRVPQVNFYRAVQGREPSSIAAAVALTFMGSRIESWAPSQRKGMEGFFSRITYKPTAEWKEEIVCLSAAPGEPLTAVFPDAKTVRIEPGTDPRAVFADWLIRPENQWFSKAIVNRIWSWVMGRGIIHEPDDIRPDNAPTNPELLAYLQEELVKSKWDLRHVYKLILSSRTYQQSSIAQSDSPDVEKYFAVYPVRRLDAEVLIDVLCRISGTKESYSSAIPEPFTFVPEEHRSIELADGSITSQFLEMFGRPSRDTGLESERNNLSSDAQRLHLLNSTHVQNKIEKSWKLNGLVTAAKDNRKAIITMVYMNVLSRDPTAEEFKNAEAYFQTEGIKSKDAVNDLVWALINSKEFLYRH